jgi:peptidyl-prolyl cis-trans isomerase SurA
MNRQQILQILAKSGVTENTLRRQLQASIAWERLTQGRFGSSISVTQVDINQSLEQLRANADKPQFWVMEIFLGVSSPEEEESVRKTMEGFMDQMRSGKGSFPSIARQFSQSASAGSGGDIGWVTANALPENVAEAVQQMRKGSLSIPIRDVGGYYMVALRDKRIGVGVSPDQVKLTLKQVVIPSLPDFPQQYMQMAGGQAVRISQAKPSCDDAEKIGRQVETARYSDLGTKKVSELTKPFQDAIAGLQAGDVTPPVRSNVGFHVLMICDRQTEGDGLPSRKAIEDRLYSQQLSMVQRRYLRDLRRDATVEMRDEEKKK